MFEYDHTLLSFPDLHKIGIRSTRELEEVIEWKFSHCTVDEVTLEFPVYVITGLTEKCKGVSVVVKVNDEGVFVTLDVIVPSRDEFLKSLLA